MSFVQFRILFNTRIWASLATISYYTHSHRPKKTCVLVSSVVDSNYEPFSRYLPFSKNYLSWNPNFKFCVSLALVEFGDLFSQLTYRDTWFEKNMYVVNSGWIDWFAINRFSRTQLFQLCVLQTLLKWLSYYFLRTFLLRDSFLNIVVASSGWIGWIANPRKNDFSQTPNFELCVFQTLLKWLSCYSLLTIWVRDSFLYIRKL